ncbi:NAD-dependent succinate-semialdehyde dehydrogenase [Vibrio sp.]|uniref:NAD-dependent succinate-semialdehyde dehydrogenase n=1 Tax=Vibrio viridaestus TaxID=2487322 RepID=A0A3N9TCV8_9VIBR|nr:NAD-dependent succinate-semialdehyde dehydrogenase [Vibrio viridaestus]MDC0610261.1 NAD-dependent succinate-semialdehyde dehydrogenase [Vibrio sp.]RQW61880.1 NAD-dependent succinate-semialdehyde dehydrogenase [Vibrio viridaestus]
MINPTIREQLSNPVLLTDRAYINGSWVESDNKKTIDVINPSNQQVIASVPDLSGEQILSCIEMADNAWRSWKKTTAADRAAMLMTWYHLMMDNQNDLGLIMTLEQGKPLAEAKGEVAYAASFIKWFAEEARRVHGETHQNPSSDRRMMTIKQPIGVCAAITPWNFPAAMITRKCAPAIAAGCPIIVKPADLTPLSALALAVLAEKAGIPAGIFNVVTGDAATVGEQLTASPTVRKITFTGSTRVGSLLMAQSAPTIKRLSLELGGNAPFIVFGDADIPQAVEGLMASKFRNAGQTCVCANRVLVHNSIYDEFTQALMAAVDKLKIGDGLEDGVTIGPLINTAAVEKVKRHIEDATSKGAEIAYGEVPDTATQFVKPTIMTNVTTDMVVAQEETFGPLAPLFRFETDEEAIAIANSTPYGLGAYYYTQNLQRAWHVGEALEFGMVGLNSGVISMDSAPFGGIKLSGLGREGSNLGIEEYLEVKSWHMGGF